MSRPDRGPARYAARRDDGRRVAQVAGPLERRDEDRARAVDLDGAVVGAVRLTDVRRGEVGVEVERLAAIARSLRTA